MTGFLGIHATQNAFPCVLP